jgi:C4-dicarboxylate-specific signal transduction histidine kinase
MDKIFQPSFTTKPTGQGTGLGLSSSYDKYKGSWRRAESGNQGRRKINIHHFIDYIK